MINLQNQQTKRRKRKPGGSANFAVEASQESWLADIVAGGEEAVVDAGDVAIVVVDVAELLLLDDGTVDVAIVIDARDSLSKQS